VALDTVAIGVVLSIPDYPYSHLTRKEVVGVPIYGVTASMWEWIHPCEMMLSETVNRMGDEYVHMPMPATAGDYVLVVSATGLTVVDARDRAYRRLKRLSVPNSPMYRTDIGNRLSKQLPKLQRWGYARGLRFTQNLT
jgi:phosphoribosylamine--glycine ligase